MLHYVSIGAVLPADCAANLVLLASAVRYIRSAAVHVQLAVACNPDPVDLNRPCVAFCASCHVFCS